MNSKQLKSLPVLSIADGAQVGTVARAYLDLAARRIAGFAVHTKSGIFEVESEPKIDAEKVHTLGAGGLMIDDASATHGAAIEARLGELVAMDDLGSRVVLTEGGAALGHVASVDFDERTFAVTRLEVSAGLFKSNRQAAISDVVTIGPEYVVVRGAVAGDDYVAEDQPTSRVTTSRRVRWVEADQQPPSAPTSAPSSASPSAPPATSVEPAVEPPNKPRAKRKPAVKPEDVQST